MAYEQHAGVAGGGSLSSSATNDIPVGEELDFDEVINQTVPLCAEILYAYPIDGDSVVSYVASIQDLFGINSTGASANILIDNIDANLSKTNSARFYSGEVAQQNIGKMHTIKDNINSLAGYSGQLSVEEIKSEIESYNKNLNEIKKNARRELLETAAEEFNKKNVEWEEDGFPKTKTYRFKDYEYNPVQTPYDDPEFGYCNGSDKEEYDCEDIDYDSYKTDVVRDPETNNIVSYTTVYTRKWRIHKYKRIKCHFGLKFLQTWWDPTFEEIEQRFKDVNCPLPYDAENLQVLSSKEKNNTLGINGKY